MKKACLLLAVVLVTVCVLSGCSWERYREEDIIGLTVTQVVEKYGEFDKRTWDLYARLSGWYITKPARKGFLGTSYTEYFVIDFDYDGVAVKCYRDTDGWGG